jgi:hypothetical protein
LTRKYQGNESGEDLRIGIIPLPKKPIFLIFVEVGALDLDSEEVKSKTFSLLHCPLF